MVPDLVAIPALPPFSIGRTPVRTVASPAQVRGGVRLRLGAR